MTTGKRSTTLKAVEAPVASERDLMKRLLEEALHDSSAAPHRSTARAMVNSSV